MNAMTAAHKTLPLPTYARVTNLENGKTAVVRINDRGPFYGPRVIDLSRAAATKLGVLGTGTTEVEVRALDPTSSEPVASNPFLIAANKPKAEAQPQPFLDSLAEFGTARFEAPATPRVADSGRAVTSEVARPFPQPERRTAPAQGRELAIVDRPAEKLGSESPAQARAAEARAAKAEARLAAKEAEAKARLAAKEAKAEARLAAKDTKAARGRDPVEAAPAKGKALAEVSPKGGKSDKTAKAEKSEKSEKAGKSAKGGSGMYVQAGAFGDRANAEQLRKRLVKELAQLQVQVRSIDGKASQLYKVQVGPLDSRAKASHVSQRLAGLGVTKAHVVVE
jgi:rare lipoprotein A